MLTNPQGVPWPGWNAAAFRLRWLSFYDRAHELGLEPYHVLETALGMETFDWGWERFIDDMGAGYIPMKTAYVMVQWEAQGLLELFVAAGFPQSGGEHTVWHTVKLFKGTKEDVQTVLGMFVWWAVGAVLWD